MYVRLHYKFEISEGVSRREGFRCEIFILGHTRIWKFYSLEY